LFVGFGLDFCLLLFFVLLGFIFYGIVATSAAGVRVGVGGLGGGGVLLVSGGGIFGGGGGVGIGDIVGEGVSDGGGVVLFDIVGFIGFLFFGLRHSKKYNATHPSNKMSEIQLHMLYLILVRMVVYHGSNACETSEIIKAMALIYQL
jgi:hypothetical protein